MLLSFFLSVIKICKAWLGWTSQDYLSQWHYNADDGDGNNDNDDNGDVEKADVDIDEDVGNDDVDNDVLWSEGWWTMPSRDHLSTTKKHEHHQ